MFIVGVVLATRTEALMRMPTYLSERDICESGEGLCEKKDMKYEYILDVQPGFQWDDAGGYCGSWATQRAVLAKGAWISQQQVRDHTSPCGGHDNEILSCNIEEAWDNLKLDYEGFDFENETLPQTQAYFKWLKKQLASRHSVAWMIMWSGQSYPIYDLTPPAGMYGHVEPVVGIQSNHPLNDTTFYDDDVAVHFTDGGINKVYRTISTLPCQWAGVNEKADCGDYSYGVGNPYGFGWAVKGFANDEKAYVPTSLHVEPWRSEPDTRSGEKPESLKGTLKISELVEGETYDIYRWDSVKEALTYSDDYVKTSFKASSDTREYEDETSFQSDGTTYYRVVLSKEG